MSEFDAAIIGAGIVGLATAAELTRRQPGVRIVVLEKEAGAAEHQTGRNSGVIHSGIYYSPGSFRARFARAGAESMVRYCGDNGVSFERCGKLVVATSASELPALNALEERAKLNQIPVRRLHPSAAREIEPEVACIAAIHVPSTGITSYREVAQKLAEESRSRGAVIKYRNRVVGIRREMGIHRIEADAGEYSARFLINCSGLYSDRICSMAGQVPPARIVPFRGEYYELVAERKNVVRSLIYPLPDPRFPFLGVHLTKMIEGGVHAGPNAVLSLAREGYDWSRVDLQDLSETICNPGFWRLVVRYHEEGIREILRSFSKALFTRSVQRLVPSIQQSDLVPSAAGVRAQSLGEDGRLLDDFCFAESEGALHVCNAPSPAATASLEIAKEIVSRLPLLKRTTLVAGVSDTVI